MQRHAAVLRPQQACVAWLLLLLAAYVSGCFITNCPAGGKRAIDPPRSLRQCMRCGPGGVGQCFGPDICCGATIGCHLKSRESAPCAAENSIPVSCEVGTPPCADGAGRCAADGLCCSEESCTVDESCRLSPASQTETARLADILRSLMPNGDGVSLSRHYGYQRR